MVRFQVAGASWSSVSAGGLVTSVKIAGQHRLVASQFSAFTRLSCYECLVRTLKQKRIGACAGTNFLSPHVVMFFFTKVKLLVSSFPPEFNTERFSSPFFFLSFSHCFPPLAQRRDSCWTVYSKVFVLLIKKTTPDTFSPIMLEYHTSTIVGRCYFGGSGFHELCEI